ncbi:hypothetical protein E4U13_002040 [Claviceps humidiphila]|uniref:Gamma-glutamyltransferase n=1 Tax=Claviceps humidiphila TaxID=1294629 RepID=A0A9P7Q1J1_9HYPO|nr:hypothetical protein E4U13_002040 [Claviceps humidiphila]
MMLPNHRICLQYGLLLSFAFAALATSVDDTPGPRLGAVASENSVCSRIGTRLLEDGGNAVDALVGTVFCVGTVAMYHSGIGGGGFLLLRKPNGSYESVDFRESAPAAAFEDMFKHDVNASLFGGLARYMDSVSPNEFLTEDPTWAVDFAPRGRRVRLGETMTRKRYANTLEAIAEEGADAFYTGAIARATIAALKSANGTMTVEDLGNYTLAHQRPVDIEYRGHKLTSTNAPSSGIVALSALNTLSGYDDFQEPSHSKSSTHLMLEAIKWAYGQRTQLGDPTFSPSMRTYTESMISAETGAEIRSKISSKTTFDLSYYDPMGLESIETPGTSHIVTADVSGLTVSMTTTVNTLFGSQLMVPETGVIMNNEMNDFSIPGESKLFGYLPNAANFVRPGKRPLSAISPIIAETPDGKLFFSIGSAGSSRITTANIQTAIHLIDGNMTTAEALSQPRLHDQLVPRRVTFEYTYDNGTVAYLKSLHHNVTWVAPGESTAQGLRQLLNGTFEAAGEPRQRNSGGFAV